MTELKPLFDTSAEEPIVKASQIALASADLQRINAEVAKFDADPEAYIRANYRRLVEWDFPVFAAINVNIQDKRGRRVTLVSNRVQRRLWGWLIDDIVAGRPVRWMVVKGRQMGVSTWILALIYWLTSQRADRNALIAAQDDEAVKNFNSRFRGIHAMSHESMRSPTLTNRRELVHFGTSTRDRSHGAGVGLDSRVVFATAGHSELGRSYNFHMVLLSEFAIWPEMGIDVMSQMAALNQTIADLPGTCVFLESTCKGENDATKFWRDRTNGFRKIFVSWVAFDEYRKPRKTPLGPLSSLDDHRYGNEVAEARLIRDALYTWYPDEVFEGGEEWIKAEVEARLNWRRYCIDVKCNGDVSKFRSEYPTIAQHAFQGTGKNCFDQHSIKLMREHVEREGLQVQRFTYTHDPDNNDPNVKFTPNPYGPVRVYKLPEHGQVYVIGADASQGIQNSGDPSAFVILSVPDLEEVASYSGIITPDQYAEMLYYIGLIYNTALLGVESNDKGGWAANLKLSREMCYPRLFYRFDPFDKKAASKPGYNTTDANKSVMVSAAQQLIRDHELLIRTDEALEQIQNFVLLKDGTMGGAPGYQDDYVSALLIALHLASKVHMYEPARQTAPKGSFEWHARRHAQRNKPGIFGYLR